MNKLIYKKIKSIQEYQKIKKNNDFFNFFLDLTTTDLDIVASDFIKEQLITSFMLGIRQDFDRYLKPCFDLETMRHSITMDEEKSDEFFIYIDSFNYNEAETKDKINSIYSKFTEINLDQLNEKVIYAYRCYLNIIHSNKVKLSSIKYTIDNIPPPPTFNRFKKNTFEKIINNKSIIIINNIYYTEYNLNSEHIKNLFNIRLTSPVYSDRVERIILKCIKWIGNSLSSIRKSSFECIIKSLSEKPNSNDYEIIKPLYPHLVDTIDFYYEKLNLQSIKILTFIELGLENNYFLDEDKACIELIIPSNENEENHLELTEDITSDDTKFALTTIPHDSYGKKIRDIINNNYEKIHNTISKQTLINNPYIIIDIYLIPENVLKVRDEIKKYKNEYNFYNNKKIVYKEILIPYNSEAICIDKFNEFLSHVVVRRALDFIIISKKLHSLGELDKNKKNTLRKLEKEVKRNLSFRYYEEHPKLQKLIIKYEKLINSLSSYKKPITLDVFLKKKLPHFSNSTVQFAPHGNYLNENQLNHQLCIFIRSLSQDNDLDINISSEVNDGPNRIDLLLETPEYSLAVECKIAFKDKKLQTEGIKKAFNTQMPSYAGTRKTCTLLYVFDENLPNFQTKLKKFIEEQIGVTYKQVNKNDYSHYQLCNNSENKEGNIFDIYSIKLQKDSNSKDK
ncbi:hypothetical protein HHE94_18260 [Pseudoalteromonas arctica]|uniref:Uncharacterized protein n=1 Tax=Pseudoalteromonas arctica TaxID=394751 RepID=A0AAP6Y8V2_9GAMM|nr:hypothetical protein [Pseudoalteromonas arctica]NMP04648.1 hypothetical protein [Pseudoalteromonas arctica]